MASRPFTAADDKAICDLHAQGLTWREIAHRLGRPSGWCVSYRWKLLHKPAERAGKPGEARRRKCMRCPTVFDSPHFGVRHCTACRDDLQRCDDGLPTGFATPGRERTFHGVREDMAEHGKAGAA